MNKNKKIKGIIVFLNQKKKIMHDKYLQCKYFHIDIIDK